MLWWLAGLGLTGRSPGIYIIDFIESQQIAWMSYCHHLAAYGNVELVTYIRGGRVTFMTFNMAFNIAWNMAVPPKDMSLLKPSPPPPPLKGRSFAGREGGRKRYEVGLTWELKVLAILKGGGGTKSFHSLNVCVGGGANSFTVSSLAGDGGSCKKLGPTIFPLCSPPPRN